MTRVAFGAVSLEALTAGVAARAVGGLLLLTTRYRPKRFEELIGGSLYWIIKHQLVARMEIAEFIEDSAIAKWHICVKTPLIVVRPQARRAHQGWRYLDAADAPADLFGPDGGEMLPTGLTAELAGLGLV